MKCLREKRMSEAKMLHIHCKKSLFICILEPKVVLMQEQSITRRLLHLKARGGTP